MTRAATLASGTPVALLTNGTVRLARGFASITETAPSFTAYCTFSRPRTSSASARRRVYSSMVAIDLAAVSVGGGIAHAESPECTPACLDVLHDAADEHLAGGVAERVDVDLDRVLEEAVDQRGPLGDEPALAAEACPCPDELGHRRVEAVVVVRRSAWPVRRARRTAARAPGSRCVPRSHARASAVVAVPPAGWRIAEPFAQRVELLAVLGEVDRGGAGAEHRDTRLLERLRQLQRRLAAEATTTPASSPRSAQHARRSLRTPRCVSGSKNRRSLVS